MTGSDRRAQERTDAPLFFLIAGEPSGDLLGARLMAALRRRAGGEVRFAGIGGEQMAAEGLRSRFPMSELALMGLVEILPHLPRLLRRMTETAAAIRNLRPDAVVTIDAPAFNFRLAARLQGSGIPVVHYVAPSVWAWRAGRARRIAGFLDHVLALLPFEPPHFEAHGLACTYVGHPVLESPAADRDGAAFLQRHGLAPDGPVICVLPGSRTGEVSRLLPIFGRALGRLAARHPGLTALLPTVPAVLEPVRRAAEGWSLPTTVVTGADERAGAFAAADVALAASGTVILELAAAGVPTVAAYRANPVTAALLRRLLTVRYVTLVNLILDRSVVPELLQEHCTPAELESALDRLLSSTSARAAQRAGFEAALAKLAVPEPPSDRAADVILTVARRRQAA